MPLRDLRMRLPMEGLYIDRNAYMRAPVPASFPVYVPDQFEYHDQMIYCDGFRDFVQQVTDYLRAGARLFAPEEAVAETYIDQYDRSLIFRTLIGPQDEIRQVSRQCDERGLVCINPQGLMLSRRDVESRVQYRNREQINARALQDHVRQQLQTNQQQAATWRERGPLRVQELNLQSFDQPSPWGEPTGGLPDEFEFDENGDLIVGDEPGPSFADLGGQITNEREPKPIPEPIPERKTIIRNLKVAQAAPPSTAPATPRRRMKLEGKT